MHKSLSHSQFHPVLFARWVLPIGAAVALFPIISSAIALFMGITIAITLGNPYLDRTRRITHPLLSLSIIGLGAGMNLETVGRAGAHGIVYTIVSIALTFALGNIIGKILNTERNTSLLITVGTAICGGSAIAAAAPTIRAKPQEVSIALATVFLLNATALLLFPWVGHQIGLTETQFGLWSALAIHDTSSVVGATLQYGPQALEVGTTVKLARALWIVPITFIIGLIYSRRSRQEGAAQPIKRPWFILGFIISAACVTWIPVLQPAGHLIENISRRTLVLTLFFIGTNLTVAAIRAVGWQPMIQGLILWILMTTLSLGSIVAGWIS